MRAPRLVDTLAVQAWKRVFPGRPILARMPAWLRRADVALSVAALSVVFHSGFAGQIGPLRAMFFANDDQLSLAGQVLVCLSCPCGIIAGIGFARLGAALDQATLRHGLRALDGWFPLRGRWLGLVLCLTFARRRGSGVVRYRATVPAAGCR